MVINFRSYAVDEMAFMLEKTLETMGKEPDYSIEINDLSDKVTDYFGADEKSNMAFLIKGFVMGINTALRGLNDESN